MTTTTKGRRREAVMLALIAATSWACGGGGSSSQSTRQDAAQHGNGAGDIGAVIILRDAAGAPLRAGATVAYSPERTCGACHDVSTITKGYHFQQGRTALMAKADPNVIANLDGYNTAKPWLLSDGMYGKW